MVNSRSSLNVNNGIYLNVLKGNIGGIEVNNQSANGYPITAPSASHFINLTNLDQSYFGHWILKWTGTGGFFMANGILIYSGDSYIQGGKTTTGSLKSTSSNTTINGASGTGAISPTIEFAFGFPATNVFKAPSTNLIRISSPTGYITNGASNYSTGDTVLVQNVGGQVAANGTFLITVIDAQTIELQSSTWNAGTPYTSGGEIICPARSLNTSWYLLNSGNGGVFSGFDNLVMCKLADQSAIAAGQIWAQSYVDQLIYLKPSWLRFMDAMGVQGQWSADFAARQSASFAVYGGSYCQSQYVPTPTGGKNIFWSAGDAYTCAAPTLWSGLVDNAIVQGIIDITNVGLFPTLNVGGTGARPIVDNNIRPLRIIFSAGDSTVGDILTFRFSASYISGGSRDVSYTTVLADSNKTTLGVNVLNAIGADSVLKAAGIGIGNDGSGGTIIYYPADPYGSLTVTQTVGPAICDVTRLPVGTLNTTTSGSTFIYSILLGAWIYQSGGSIQAIPCEAIVELCNRVGANAWVNYPVFTKAQYITDFTSYMGDSITGLTSGLQFGMEFGNEVFLFSGSVLPARCATLGGCFGWVSTDGIAGSAHSWAGAKISQYAPLSKAAWIAKGRIDTDHYVLNMGQFGSPSNWSNYQMNGALLGVALYTTYGGMGAGSTPAANIAGSQPADFSDAGGSAPYWAGPFFGNTVNNVAGTVSDNSSWLAASLLYAQGNTSAAYDALYYGFLCANVPTTKTRNYTNLPFCQSNNTFFYTRLSSYDARRLLAGKRKLAYMEYEAGPQFSINVNNLVSGTTTPTGDITSLANRMTTLGWNVDIYDNLGGTGATAITNVATQTNAMLYYFKFSTQYYNLFLLRYTQTLGTFPDRECHPGQYGYSGNTWSLFPSAAAQSANLPYSSYKAIHDFNNTTYNSYEGLVATRCRMMGPSSSSGNKQIMFRSAHVATEDLTAIRVNFQNFYNCSNLGGSPITDSGRGSSASIMAAIEYNGICTQLTFGGFSPPAIGAGTIPNSSTVWSDYCGVNIPSGATFWIRIFTTNSGGVIFNTFQNSFLGECLQVAASGLTDLTLTPGTFTQTGVNWSTPPLAIVGITKKASVIIVGDSIAAGQGDTEDTSNSASGRDSKIGNIARSIPNSVPFVMIARSGATAQNWLTDAVAANVVITKGSQIICDLGSNDINSSRTKAQIESDLQNIYALAWSKQKKFQLTIGPRSLSTDGWITLGNQSAVGSFNNAACIALNTDILSILPNTTGSFDVGNVWNSSQNSGKWVVTPSPPYTADGVHGNVAGYLLISNAGVISAPTWNDPIIRILVLKT